MSQIYKSGGGGGGSGPINTLTPDTGGAVSPVANNINVNGTPASGGVGLGITTVNGGAGVLQINLNNYSNQAVTTTNATPNTTMAVPLGATPGTYIFDASLAAFNTNDTTGAGFFTSAVIRTTGAAGVLIGIPDNLSEAEGTMTMASVSVNVSANNAVFQVTGLAGKTIDWRLIVEWTFVS